ncbi:MAG: hypothetical protein QOG46_1312 [Pseudonocardiales bacterium]|nr:hypothetical protein [Pseudonocardiales bacterium]
MALGRRLGPATHDRVTAGDQQRNVRAKQADAGITGEAGSGQSLVKKFLVNGGDLVPRGQMRAVESDEIDGLGEGLGERRAVALVPPIQDLRERRAHCCPSVISSSSPYP